MTVDGEELEEFDDVEVCGVLPVIVIDAAVNLAVAVSVEEVAVVVREVLKDFDVEV